MAKELWCPVVGYEGLYEISSLGRLKRIAPSKGTTPGRIASGSLDSSGYRQVRLCSPGRPKKCIGLHLVVAFAFLGPRPEGMQCNHIDGDKANNKLSNLEWVTESRNQQHRRLIRKGKAEKLTPDKVRKIRRLLAEHPEYGMQRQIAAMVGVRETEVCRVKKGTRWWYVD